MKKVAHFVWFLLHSWTFLGCDRGRGRWDARRHYIRNVIPASRIFVRKMAQP